MGDGGSGNLKRASDREESAIPASTSLLEMILLYAHTVQTGDIVDRRSGTWLTLLHAMEE